MGVFKNDGMFLDLIPVLFLGLALGSFASAVSWRVPRELSWFAARGKAAHSACPSCGHRLGWADLVPLFSWLMLRGRCRYCRAAIGWRYPLIELATAAGCVAVYAVYGFSLSGVILMAALPFFVALIAIDFEHMILPDQINLVLAGLGAGFVLTRAPEMIWQSIAAAFVYAALAFALGWVMQKLLKKEALGLGDVKFFAVAGLWLGLAPFPLYLILSGLFGVGIGVIFRIWKGDALFPFGPALVLALLACLLIPAEIRGFSGVFGAGGL